MEMLNEIKNIYSHMEDDISKEVYVNRFLYNTTGDLRYMRRVLDCCGISQPILAALSMHKKQKKVIFGAGWYGKNLKNLFPEIDWCCFVDNKIPFGTVVEGLKCVSFEALKTQYRDDYIVISTRLYHKEISKQLYENEFSSENIFNLGEYLDHLFSLQYFDCPNLKCGSNEIFVDAGVLDGYTSANFIRHVKDQYKAIYMFEPNVLMSDTIKQNLFGKKNCYLIKKGLWDKEEYKKFDSYTILEDNSCLPPPGGICSIPVTTLDAELRDIKVTFIKMDIEGAELRALKGAEYLIRSFHPKMAICIYHKVEDLWAIPAFILECYADYKFYVRHYSTGIHETVLYAI